AIENAELYQQRRQAEEAERLRTQELEALYGMASTLVQPASFEQRCKAVLELVARAADADSAFIRVVSEDGQSLHLVAETNPGQLPSRPTTTVRWGEGLAGAALKEGRPVASHDNLVQDLGTGRGRERGARSSVALPVKTGERPLGVINVVSRKPNYFTPEGMRLLSAIADGLGMLLENSRLSQELQATAGEMQVADEMAQVITSTLNIDEVYEKFAQELRKHVGFDWMNINFIDPDANVLTLKYLVGQAQTGYRVGNVLPLEGTQSQHVMLTGKSLVRDDISNDLSFPSDPTMAELGLRSNIVVPLVTKGRVIASLGLRSKEVGAYGNREKVILERLAKQ
ncbi:MAG TPA: GAF domain-containing protein, partial [Dehalococcoidia bacterium]|nr:GAF domain-containing protein [Dehalococcoidia bacterium]